MKEEEIKNIFKDIFKNRKGKVYNYSLDGYVEGNVCLEKSNNKWLVYYARNYKKEFVREYDSLINALLEIIESIEYENIICMKQTFLDSILSFSLKKHDSFKVKLFNKKNK